MTEYVPVYEAATSSTECTSSVHVVLHIAPRHGAVTRSTIEVALFGFICSERRGSLTHLNPKSPEQCNY